MNTNACKQQDPTVDVSTLLFSVFPVRKKIYKLTEELISFSVFPVVRTLLGTGGWGVGELMRQKFFSSPTHLPWEPEVF